MRNKFTKKTAKTIADKNFDLILDCILGYSDPDYSLDTKIEDLEQSFTEDLEDANITATPKRIEIISSYYQKKVDRAVSVLSKLYSKQ